MVHFLVNKILPLLCLRLSFSANFVIDHIMSFMSFHAIKRYFYVLKRH
jgi:hypothetical protein